MSYETPLSAPESAPDVADRGVTHPQPPRPAAPVRNNRFFPRKITAELVLKAFNTRAFKREKPDNPDLMLNIIDDALKANAPVPFVFYWGKGPRPFFGAPELQCLDYIDAMMERIRQLYPTGVDVTLIFTDTHAALNGHKREAIYSYYAELTAHAATKGFKTELLSALIDKIDLPLQADAAQAQVPSYLMATLRGCAAKWFRGEGTVEEGATRYYRANMIERKVVELIYPRAIFVSFNGSEMRDIFPEHLPVFYMFSIHHGISDKPWFLPSEPIPATGQGGIVMG
ncbi:hypothetical protein [Methylocella sp. CPCC 101449]|jgi:hypothetical protein|uniref:hypothetical protein n=1 Tax=Methylocella sp. CPCC 101449 TaxID=2987531 RepID=UPI00288DE333|nr:hypothetical protein [Methylocella sp. CPCC 101449]MDT2020276.1 hypothetical protein [Methylocella sp. CPCC 101449]HEV2574784.1 hypothetical protein [Beijerinckiaceae bacterium]